MDEITADDEGWYRALNTTSYTRFKVFLNPYGKKGHTFYYRATFKYLSDVVSKLSFDYILFHGTGSGFTATIDPDVEYTYSNIDQFTVGYELDYSNIYVNTNGEGNETDVYVKDLMVIDITEIEETYPTFGALSVNDKKKILDKIPTIALQESFEFTRDYLESLDINLSSVSVLSLITY